MHTPYCKRQEAIERALGYVDELILQGKSRSEAVDHAFQRFGCERSSLVRLLNERDYGIMGSSGETVCGCVGSPQGLMGTA